MEWGGWGETGETNVEREGGGIKRLTRGPWEIYNAGNKPNFPPTKDRWTTLNSMSFQSEAMKTITASTPNQECIGCELMRVGTAAELAQPQQEAPSVHRGGGLGCRCASAELISISISRKLILWDIEGFAEWVHQDSLMQFKEFMNITKTVFNVV